ncbi:ubiquitin-like small modifier protein 1 [Aeromicrobium sp. CTD01-1L150]|uniref:ubiquitin-like small modifier protein 1 n=1 Tax=Aeromicrobium sp. CTD01-1L150 TaxID=3341830 RepID=UPI0035C1C5FD
MTIEVRIPTILRTYTDGERAVEGSGETVAELVESLESSHTGIKERLLEDDGAIRRFVNVYVNDEDVRFTGGLQTALSDGDTVVILPAVAGGSATHPIL